MLVNLVPEFLATLAAPDPSAAYHEYLDRYRPVLSAYWQNYVLDPDSPHAEPIIDMALRADRTDLKRLLEDVDVVAVADEALRRATEMLEADCPLDLYLMVGVGAANAGELVVGGRGIAAGRAIGHLRSAAADESQQRHFSHRRFRPPAHFSAGPSQPLDRAAGPARSSG